MKLFLRGAFALGISIAIASTALSDTPPPPTAPTNRVPAMPAGPVVAQPAAANCVTGTEVVGPSRKFGGRLFGGGHIGTTGRFSGLSGRFDALSARIDEGVAKSEERQDRFNEFLRRLAGPPVDGTASTGGGGHAPKANTQPGTVVFPQHPFVRSPRDYFMQD